MALATLCFAALDATGKYLIVNHGVPVIEVSWLRFVGHVVFSAVALWPLAHALAPFGETDDSDSSLLMVVTTGFNFLALRYLQLDQTITIFFSRRFWSQGSPGRCSASGSAGIACWPSSRASSACCW